MTSVLTQQNLATLRTQHGRSGSAEGIGKGCISDLKGKRTEKTWTKARQYAKCAKWR